MYYSKASAGNRDAIHTRVSAPRADVWSAAIHSALASMSHTLLSVVLTAKARRRPL